jgi:phosphoribosylformimino-5-aminoimidazole carboxamide ribotide isomerase
MIVIPSIDLRQGKVVRLQQGDYARQLDYPVDPVETARSYAAAGAKWMHIVDLDGAKEGRPVQTDLIAQIARSSGLMVQVGGGIRERKDIDLLLNSTVQRVVIGTKAMEDWAWFESLAHDPAYQNRLILALDAKDGKVAVKGWTQTTRKLATDVARQISNWPVAAILYTDVAKDGMMTGPNFQQTQAIAQAGKIPVIASGGVGNLDHIRQLAKLNVWGAIVGRSLYEGTVDLREAIAIANQIR